MKKNTIVAVAIFAVVVIAASAYFIFNQNGNSEEETLNRVNGNSEEETLNRVAVIETNLGTMEIELFNDKAPRTVSNFVDLIEKGFYDGVIFHRIISGFMIQGGDPTGTGRGGPGYTIDDEFHPDLKHDSKGILSMANAGPNTGGSQFFITLAPTPHLDNRHAVFGKLIKGEEILDKIGAVETGPNDKPINEVKMIKVTIK
jgi:peptidyl-prolyl cis-trans isomerase A (cyclophilin A)